ncbi:MAG: signal peptidase [Solirubrobacteraceae bacterium]|nr:signal peptidase [Solirubrobacteraceae bacterium]
MAPVARAWLRAGLVLAVVFALDQITKALVRSGLAVGQEDPVFPAVTLVHVRNRGVAFSALEGRTGLVTVVIGLAVLALVIWFARHATRRLVWLPVGLLAGGAAGNIVDRARHGAVTDFIKLPAWPAFNVADMAITFGVLALLYVVERSDAPDR